LNEALPDHSSLSCTRYGIDVFRRFFDAIVQQCQQAKLVWGKELYFDSTQVNANADLDSLTSRFAVEAREAIQHHLATLFAEDAPQQEHDEENRRNAPAPERLPESTSCPLPTPLSPALSQAQRENLLWTMPHGMTGSRREVGSSGKYMAFISGAPTSG
jgi:hypothetical protein